MAATCTTRNGQMEISPADVDRLKKMFVYPVCEVSTKLKKNWKMNKGERQHGFACTVCGKPLASLKQAETHVATRPHQNKQKEKELELFLPAIPTPPSSHFETLSLFLTDVFQQHSAAAQGQGVDRQRIAQELGSFLREDGLDVSVGLFGSSASGFALISSDVNLNITISGANTNQGLIPGCMRRVVTGLMSRGTVYAEVKEDFFATNKIPRILFKEIKSGLMCEVRAEAGNPMAMSSLLQLYGAIDKRCIQLGVLFRHWAQICGVDQQEKGHYPSHMFVVMAIHFLQQRGVLPVLHQLQNPQKKKKLKDSEKGAVGEVEEDREEEGEEEGEGKEKVGRVEKTVNKAREEEENEDDVVVFEREEEAIEEEEEEEEAGDRKPKEVHSADYLSDLPQLPDLWHGSNTESLGELWYHLLRYYVVEFCKEQDAVSIRQREKLSRKGRMWGEGRLAVEDPLIPKSNLGRGTASQQVYDYLMNCLRQTMLYFSGSAGVPHATLDVSTGGAGGQGGVRTRAKVGGKDVCKPSIEWNGRSNTRKQDNDLEASTCTESSLNSDLSSSLPLRPEKSHSHEDESSIEHEDSSILYASFLSDAGSTAPDSATTNHSSQDEKNSNSTPDRDLLSGTTVTDGSVEQQVGERSVDQEPVSMTTAAQQQESSAVSTTVDTFAEHLLKLSIKEEGEEEERRESVGEKELQHQPHTTDGDEAHKGDAPNPISSPPPASGPEGPAQSTQVDTGGDSPAPTGQRTLNFSKENFVFQPYPLSCLNCKKLKHTILECPELDLAAEYQKYMPGKLPPKSSLHMFHTCFSHYKMRVMPKSEDIKWRQRVLESILDDIRVIYPGAELKMFGSSANGFGSRGSDLDLCMTMPDNDKTARGKVIESIAAELGKHKRKYGRIVAITSARVPIVKFYSFKWDIQCDISLENKLALRNTEMLATYASIDPRVPELGCALKRLAKSCDMCDAAAGSLSSYAYILMLLHYLQQVKPPVVPVLQQLCPRGEEKLVIDNWNCYFFEFKSPKELKKVWPHYNSNKSTIGELWLGMLRYYTVEFNWDQEVVAIRQLEPLSKFDKWWMSKNMCIEDPFNLDHNLGGGVSNRMRKYILDRFMDALCYHSENREWKSIDELMDSDALQGESRPPKFMICHYCGAKGHRASQCPAKEKESQSNAQPKVMNREMQGQNMKRNVQHWRQSQKHEESRLSTTRQEGKSRPMTRKERSATAGLIRVMPRPAPVHPAQGHPSLPNTPQRKALLPSPPVMTSLPMSIPQSVLSSPSVRPSPSLSAPLGQLPLPPPSVRPSPSLSAPQELSLPPPSMRPSPPLNVPQGQLPLPPPSMRPSLSLSAPQGQLPLPPPSVRAAVRTYRSQPSPHPFPHSAVLSRPQYYYSPGPMISPNYPTAQLPGPPVSPNYPTSSGSLVLTQPAQMPLSQPNSQPQFLRSNSYPSDQRNAVHLSSAQHASVFPHTASRSPPYRQTISSQHSPKDASTLSNPMGQLPTSSHHTGLQQPYYVGNNMMSYAHHHPGQLPHNRPLIVPGPAPQDHPRDDMQKRQQNLSIITNRQHKGKTC